MKDWPTQPLSEVTSCLDSQRIPVKEDDRQKRLGSVPYYGANGQVGWIDEAIFNEPLLLVAEDGGHFDEPERGVAYTIRGPSWVNNHAHILRPDKSQVLLGFLGYYFRHFDFLRYITGTTRAKLTLRDLMRVEVPVPPLAEQERLVKLLDEADELGKLRAEADRRTAELIPALFNEMFGDPVANPMTWPSHKLPDICNGKEGIKAGPFGSSLKKECYTAEGPRVYGQEQVIAGDFTIGDYHISEEKFEEMMAYAITAGDVLISLVGTIGKVAIVPDTIERGIINPRLLRVRPRREMLHPVYLSHVLTSPSVTRLFGSVATGATMGVLNAGLLKQLNVPVTPLPLQKEFAQHVAEIRELEAGQAASQRGLDGLFQSMLHSAFAGELC
jgi:type I restriction enzyme S subunit